MSETSDAERSIGALARFVKARRMKTGLSVPEISSRVDLSDTAWREVENAARPRFRNATLRKVAEGLGVSFDEILWRAGVADEAPATEEPHGEIGAFGKLEIIRSRDPEKYRRIVAVIDAAFNEDGENVTPLR